MAKNWFVRPETVWLEVEGQRIEVKKRLTIGEERKAFVAGHQMNSVGEITPNLESLGRAEVMAYLVDWTLEDETGRVRIDTDARKIASLDALDPEKFQAINKAIATHVLAMDAERAEAKKSLDGASESPAISPSVA